MLRCKMLRCKMLRKTLILGIISLSLIGLTCCSDNEQRPKKINLDNRESIREKPKDNAKKPIRIAVGGMITPKEGFGYYRQLLDYIEKKIGRPVEFVDREDYTEINNLLKTGKVDIAFVCGGPYVDGHEQFGMQILVAPVAYGGTVYYSYIIVSKDSPVDSLEDLRGRSFAFTDPLSNTGKLVPTYMLARMNETPDSFFETYDFTHAHDKSIKAVAQRLVDGAAVDSLIWEYADRVNPEFTSKTKIIAKSPPYGIPPVAAGPNTDPKLMQDIKKILMNAHTDAEGKRILSAMMIERFAEIDDSAYDSIRAMKEWIAKQAEAKH